MVPDHRGQAEILHHLALQGLMSAVEAIELLARSVDDRAGHDEVQHYLSELNQAQLSIAEAMMSLREQLPQPLCGR